MSNEISDAALLAALRRQMTLAVAKQGVAASNLSNVSTPGYRARELNFEDTLDDQLGVSTRLVTTDARHLSGPQDSILETREAEGLPGRRDGNTVQLDRELLSMTRASGEFLRAQTALAAKFRLVRYAINEGR